MSDVVRSDVLDRFSAPVAAWFRSAFPAPTAAQEQAWPAIAAGDHALVLAPTGSGKTLAAFLWGLDRLATEGLPEDKTRRTRLLYISPLRALAVDVEKNLRAPMHGIALAAERLGVDARLPTVGTRTGDTSPSERRALIRTPPDLLITTPESLYLMLTSSARDTFRGIEAVIVDEIHALAPTKRGAHLALSLERLAELTDRPFQRIGLSATQRPLDEVARFLGGYQDPAPDETERHPRPRPVTLVDAGVRKPLEVEVIVPVDDMGALGEPGPGDAGPPSTTRSIWPSMHPELLELVQSHRSTIIFVNARRLAERLATRLNELAADGVNRSAEAVGAPPVPDLDAAPGTAGGADLVMAHHGSLSRERRLQIEDDLKQGRLRGIVATSSLELGIDMGAVDLVIQVASPGSVSRGLQRIGRAGHQVGEPSKGKVLPSHRADLVEAAVVVDRMHQGLIEHTRYPRNPLDVLAQQIVAMTALDDWPVDELLAVVRRAANFAELSDDVAYAVLDLLAGRYPSEAFAELRPRLAWDRAAGVLRGRAGSQRLAVTSGGTIPDRGLYGVFLPDGTRVGELDEEMVYESRPGETFLLGASTWRIEDITPDRVVVTPAPGQPGRMPFWHGDGPGRPLELGRAVGAFVRELRAVSTEEASARLRGRHGLDERAARNLLGYLDEQAEASGGAVPDDRTVVVERFKDEIGDWRVCILTPFGLQVHAPWAMAIQARLAERQGLDVELMWSDDGIVIRLPESADSFPLDELLIDPDEIRDVVVAQLPQTSLFAARFRECAARSLLLPRRRPDRRTPLWQQRQRAADLLAVSAGYPEFPVLLETTRECLNDVFDLPALREVLTDLRSRRIRLVPVDTPRASPMAQSLLFGWIAMYMYEGDAPLAERRAAALSLDRDLLRDLLGAEELRDLLDGQVLADLELELQRLVPGRRARDADELHDLLRVLGPLSIDDLVARSEGTSGQITEWLDDLARQHRAIPVATPGPSPAADQGQAERGTQRWGAAEDAARLRDALGVAVPVGLPTAFTDPVDAPLVDLVARYARTHGPFVTDAAARHLGASGERVGAVLLELERDGSVVRGAFRPDGTDREWCDVDVLRQLRRRSLAALRREIEPVEAPALARFLLDWQDVVTPRRGGDALVEVIGSLQGLALPASNLEADVLGPRVVGYTPAALDALCTSGDLVWVGAGAIGASDGRVRLLFREAAGLLVDPVDLAELSTVGPPPDDAAAVAPGGGTGRLDPASTGADADPSDVDGLAVSPLHDAIRRHLGDRGASFWPALVEAARAEATSVGADGEPGPGIADDEILDALWDLVWAGVVTNDSLAALRSRVAGRARRGGRGGRGGRGSRRGEARSRGRRPTLGRPNLGGGLARPTAPPSAAGRWSLVAGLLEPRPSTTEVAHARTLQLLERHGVLTREAVLAEGVPGGFAGVYPVLKALEERGQVRRGYFVSGLGAAQFALPGAVDRLRSFRDDDTDHADGAAPVVVAATDPAQPYGAAIAWPSSAGHPARVAGAHVVIVEGELAAYLERGGRTLVTFDAATRRSRWAEGLVQLVKDGRVGQVVLGRIDGAPAIESPHAELLRAAGFVDSYRGLTLRS